MNKEADKSILHLPIKLPNYNDGKSTLILHNCSHLPIKLPKYTDGKSTLILHACSLKDKQEEPLVNLQTKVGLYAYVCHYEMPLYPLLLA